MDTKRFAKGVLTGVFALGCAGLGGVGACALMHEQARRQEYKIRYRDKVIRELRDERDERNLAEAKAAREREDRARSGDARVSELQSRLEAQQRRIEALEKCVVGYTFSFDHLAANPSLGPAARAGCNLDKPENPFSVNYSSEPVPRSKF